MSTYPRTFSHIGISVPDVEKVVFNNIIDQVSFDLDDSSTLRKSIEAELMQ